jgi:hypothetical protein
METEHTEGVVEKALAYVKDMFGMPPGDRTTDIESEPEYADTAPDLASDEAMRLDPHAYAFNKIVERSRRVDGEYPEKIMGTEHANSAVDEHMQAAGQIDQAKGPMRKALNDLNELSHDIREKVVDERNSSFGDSADRMRGRKDLPNESEMEETVEVAKAAYRNNEALNAAERRADEVRSWR